MSSSDPGAPFAVAEFVPDVQGQACSEFEPESVVLSHVAIERGSEIQSIDAYRPGPSEDEIRQACRLDFEAEFARRLVQERAADAATLRAVSEALQREAQAREDRLARQCVRLALTIAERLVHARIEHDTEVIERVVRDAVGQIDKVTDLVVFVHPADAAVLRSQAELLGELAIAEVREDPRQRRGGCRLESQDRSWDASLVGQLARMQDALEAILEPDA